MDPFRRGVILAILNFEGNGDDDIDLLMISVMTGNRQSRGDFSKVVGIGSRTHDLIDTNTIFPNWF